MNNDSSVKRLKGEGRPIQNENARAHVLSSLSTVDLVIFFEDDTPLKLIQLLMPDILVKGSDYKIEEIIGGDLVKKNGGEILLANIEPGYSTTKTIARMSMN